jgi:hypothetical protein
MPLIGGIQRDPARSSAIRRDHDAIRRDQARSGAIRRDPARSWAIEGGRPARETARDPGRS